jgi:hypothetical protein
MHLVNIDFNGIDISPEYEPIDISYHFKRCDFGENSGFEPLKVSALFLSIINWSHNRESKNSILFLIFLKI